MLKLPKNLYSLSVSDLTDYLIKNYSVFDIAESLAENLKDKEENDKISISYAQFRKYFRVRGLATTSPFTPETRGRKPLSPKAIAEAVEREKVYKDNGE